MKKQFFISIFALLVLSFLLIQCNETEKFGYNDKKYLEVMEALKKAEGKIPFINRCNNIELRSFNSDCFTTDDYICDEFEFIGELIDQTIDYNDDCKAKISVKMYKCAGWNAGKLIITYIFDDFDAYPIEGECDEILEYWKELEEQGNYEQLAIEMDNFLNNASVILEGKMMSIFVLAGGGAFDCGEFNTALKADFYKSNCYQFYGILSPRDDGGLKNRGIEPDLPVDPYIPRYKCGASCCKRQTAYCRNDEGNIIPSEPIFDQIRECDPSLSEPPDIEGFKPYGDCFHDCN